MKKKILDILYYVFFIAFIFLILLQWYWENNGKQQEAKVLKYVQLSVLAFAILFRFAPKLFSGWFKEEKSEDG